MSVPTTKKECDKRGWFWNAETEICEKPVIVDIKMTLTRGSGCDDDEHKTKVPLPHRLAKEVRNALLDVSEVETPKKKRK